MSQPVKPPFAARVQPILIGLLLLGMLLIAQQFERDVYRVGMLLLIGTTLIQIPFGNIPPQANFGQTMKYLVIGFAILGSVVAFSILIVPSLLQIGRGG
jgi:hypothetical protein